MKQHSKSQVVIDGIANDDIDAIHKLLEDMRKKYKVRLRVKQDGRTSSQLLELEEYNETA